MLSRQSRIRQLGWVMLSLPLLMAVGAQNTIQIYGVKGKVSTNIRLRLDEIAQTKPLSEESSDVLEKNIIKAMEPYGFFEPTIDISARNGNRLTIRIQPGPRFLIDKISLTVVGEGRDNAAIHKAIQHFSLQKGQAFNSEAYEKAKQSLIDAADHQGYLHAAYDKAQVLIDTNHQTTHIHLEFNTGAQFFFGQVRFDPTYIHPEVLKRYIPFHYGQPFSNDMLISFNDYLIGSGYFKNVSVKPQLGDATDIPIDVHLQKAARSNYSLGIGYGTDTGIRGRAGLHVVPVNRWGHKFNAVALGSFNENAIQAQYIIPGANPLVNQYEITGGLSHLNYHAGNSTALLGSVLQRHSLTNFQRALSFNALQERFAYSYQPRNNVMALFPKASLTWLYKSDPLFTPSGYNVTINGLIANKAWLSNSNFAQTSLDAKAALTLDTIRTRIYLHTIHGVTYINPINQFPLSLALLLGGSDNLRGYDYNSIGPGKITSYGGIELQKETKEKWYLTGFFDTGDTYQPQAALLKSDVGIGIMWVSPVGPIKIGIAQPIDNQFHWAKHRNPHLVINMGPDI